MLLTLVAALASTSPTHLEESLAQLENRAAGVNAGHIRIFSHWGCTGEIGYAVVSNQGVCETKGAINSFKEIYLF